VLTAARPDTFGPEIATPVPVRRSATPFCVVYLNGVSNALPTDRHVRIPPSDHRRRGTSATAPSIGKSGCRYECPDWAYLTAYPSGWCVCPHRVDVTFVELAHVSTLLDHTSDFVSCRRVARVPRPAGEQLLLIGCKRLPLR